MRPRQLRNRLALASLGAILAGAFVGTGIAKADTVGEFADRNAAAICQILANDPSDEGGAEVIRALLARGIDGTQAGQVAWLAVHEGCPGLMPVMLRWANDRESSTSSGGGSIGGAYRA